MDKTDLRILDLLKGNARMSYQDIGNAIGMTRVAAKKRVKKLEAQPELSRLGIPCSTE